MSIEYIAGLFDGEGSFSVSIVLHNRLKGHGVNITPTMSLALKYGYEALDVIHNTFGGSVIPSGKDQDSRMWVLRKKEKLLNAANTLLPYLIVKKLNCLKFINILEMFPELPCKHGTAWDRVRTINVINAAYGLNHKGVHYKRSLKETINAANLAFDRKAANE